MCSAWVVIVYLWLPLKSNKLIRECHNQGHYTFALKEDWTHISKNVVFLIVFLIVLHSAYLYNSHTSSSVLPVDVGHYCDNRKCWPLLQHWMIVVSLLVSSMVLSMPFNEIEHCKCHTSLNFLTSQNCLSSVNSSNYSNRHASFAGLSGVLWLGHFQQIQPIWCSLGELYGHTKHIRTT